MNLHKPKTAKVLGFFLFLTFHFNIVASENIQLQFLDIWDYSELNNVEVHFNNQLTKSDSSGTVEINVGSEDQIRITINLEGYYSKIIQVKPDTQSKQIYLQPLQQTEKIQISANRLNETNLDIAGPNNIIRISAQDVNNTESVASILDNSTGIFVKDYGTGNALKTISMRGFGAEHTAINYDGININNKQLGLTELSVLNLENVSTIELYRGGNSSLFGSGAISGAVNFIPAEPSENFQYLISNSYGSWNNFQNAIMTNFNIAGINHRINISRQIGDNDFTFTINNNKYNRLNSDQKIYKFGYTLYHSNRKILAEIIYSYNNRGVPKQVVDQIKFDDYARQKDKTLFTRLKWKPNTKNTLQIYWTNQENIYNDFGLNINNQPLQSNHKNNVVGLQYLNNMILLSALRSTSKLEIEKNYINSSDAGKHSRLRAATSSILEGSIFNLNEFEINLMGSFRWENYSEIGSNFLPKIGFSFSNSNFYLYSSFGYNYRIPTFNELYWQPGGNSKLKPEKSNNFESGVSYSNKFIGQYTISLDYYSNNIKNMIRWVPDTQSSIWSPLNISGVKGEGIELSTIIEIIPSMFHIISNYSLSRTIKTKKEFDGDVTVNKQLPFIPREMANIGFKVNWKNWQGDFSWNRTGFRYLNFSNSTDEFLPAHNLIDLDLKYNFSVLNQLCTFNLQINNLLNKDYQVMYGYPMPGRNFNLSLIIQN